MRASMANPSEAKLMGRLVIAGTASIVVAFASLCYVVFGPEVSEQVTNELGGGWAGLVANT